ncbi:MAG: nitrous oxide reductase accessory protein NosL [Campylobacterota bacterium]|nr:nitrous oxide reductase accessory protein NosL [Campylobacterota bacterium]
MYKIFTYMLALYLMTGCAQQQPKIEEQEQKRVEQTKEIKKIKETAVKKEKPKYKMFQTVDKKDATLVQEGKNKQYCVRCGMDLVKFYKTSYSATHNDKEHQYCSLHCLSDHLGEGIELKNPKVVDVTTLKLIPVLEAYYVVGSKKKGTMSKVSKFAFSTLKDAEEFRKEFGGEIMDFYGALEKAKEDFKYYK